ncbi:MAG: hypothetical protein JWO94_205, partial [Verrucomicrobiaceae bacterium]|nr:hypothetical protein [Verrucomicrobiaceae bacterium]
GASSTSETLGDEWLLFDHGDSAPETDASHALPADTAWDPAWEPASPQTAAWDYPSPEILSAGWDPASPQTAAWDYPSPETLPAGWDPAWPETAAPADDQAWPANPAQASTAPNAMTAWDHASPNLADGNPISFETAAPAHALPATAPAPTTAHAHASRGAAAHAPSPAAPPSSSRPWRPNPEQLRVAAWFKRRPDTPWHPKELAAWRTIGTPHPDDLAVLERFYTADLKALTSALHWRPGEDFRRSSLLRLLGYWQGEVEKARRFNPRHTTLDDDRAF